MAIDNMTRWQILREITVAPKTGTLTVRFGRSYQHWLIKRGIVTHVSSTFPEQSLTSFLHEEGLVNPNCLKTAQSHVDERHTLGFVLVQHEFLSPTEMMEAIQRHRISLVFTLMQSSASLFWSEHEMESKSGRIEVPAPLAQTLLQAERTCIELHPALSMIEQSPGRYRPIRAAEAERWLSENERRVLDYVKSGASIDRILRDPELDRLTCYRTVFLLWISGNLQIEDRAPVTSIPKLKLSLLGPVRSIPPEWIFPFVIGMLLGILAMPHSQPELTKPEGVSIDRRQDMLEKPSWRSPD